MGKKEVKYYVLNTPSKKVYLKVIGEKAIFVTKNSIKVIKNVDNIDATDCTLDEVDSCTFNKKFSKISSEINNHF